MVGLLAGAVSVVFAAPVAASGSHGSHGSHGAHGARNASHTHATSNTGSTHNPPGNNGTVKVHRAANDATHANQPHVSCQFFVDLWGFDTGQSLAISFAGQAPTGAGITLSLNQISGTNPVVSPDAAGGGRDFDGEAGFEATASQLATLGAPAAQGYHVRLTVATGQGGGKKTKVFWVSPCTTAQTPLSPTTTATTVLGTTVTRSSTANTTTRVLGEHVVRQRPAVSAARASTGSLPFTGTEIAAIALVAALALAFGVVLLTAARYDPTHRAPRRRQRA